MDKRVLVFGTLFGGNVDGRRRKKSVGKILSVDLTRISRTQLRKKGRAKRGILTKVKKL